LFISHRKILGSRFGGWCADKLVSRGALDRVFQRPLKTRSADNTDLQS
jgi:hypothetical protein